MRRKNVVSFFESVLLIILLCAMLIQCIFYIRLAGNGEDGSLPAFPESEMKLLSEGVYDSGEKAKNPVIPYFTGVIKQDGMYGGAYGDALSYELYDCFLKVIKNASGGTSKKIAYSGVDKKYEYLDELYSGNTPCYYVKLREGIEFSVFCTLASDTYTELPENPGFLISDMFLVRGASGEASIIAVDPDGNVLKIYPSKNITFNNEYFETYNNTEKDAFCFESVPDNISAGKNCYFPVYSYSVKHKSIRRADFSEFFNISAEGADIKNFVDVFGMNDDNTKFYRRNSDGAMICIEDTVSLEISPDGSFVFYIGQQNETVPVFTDSSSDEFADYAELAESTVGKLMKMLGASCAKYSLDDVVYTGSECIFFYNITVDGIPVEIPEKGYALELKFSEGKLCGARGKAYIYMYGTERYTDMPQKTAHALMEKRGTVSWFGPEYTYVNDTGTDAYIRWTVRYIYTDKGGQQ